MENDALPLFAAECEQNTEYYTQITIKCFVCEWWTHRVCMYTVLVNFQMFILLSLDGACLNRLYATLFLYPYKISSIGCWFLNFFPLLSLSFSHSPKKINTRWARLLFLSHWCKVEFGVFAVGAAVIVIVDYLYYWNTLFRSSHCYKSVWLCITVFKIRLCLKFSVLLFVYTSNSQNKEKENWEKQRLRQKRRIIFYFNS